MKMNELMIYQVFPLRALTDGQPSHGILEMIDWIPHIKKLGMNAVYFSPVFSSSDHGYDTKDYQKIDERLGTNEDFKKMCDAMHEEGNIGAFGASNWTHTRIEEANEYAYKHNLIPFSVSSPNFCLARQIEDPWGGGCVNISGPENIEARAWYEKNQMPVIAYASLGRGFFSGRMKSVNADHAEDYLDSLAMKGYASPDNFERLRRCEILAEKHGVTVAQIAMSWIFSQPLNIFAIASMSKADRMKANREALLLQLSDEEIAYLAQ